MATAEGAPLVEDVEEATPPEGAFPSSAEPAPHEVPTAPVANVRKTDGSTTFSQGKPGAGEVTIPAESAKPAASTENATITELPPKIQPKWGEMLKAVSPAIAKVGCDEHWYSGFFPPTATLVETPALLLRRTAP